jgi:hypothetical protein
VLTYAETQSGLPDARSIELTKLLGKFYPVVAQREFQGIEILLFSTGDAEKQIATALPPQGLAY